MAGQSSAPRTLEVHGRVRHVGPLAVAPTRAAARRVVLGEPRETSDGRLSYNRTARLIAVEMGERPAIAGPSGSWRARTRPDRACVAGSCCRAWRRARPIRVLPSRLRPHDGP